MATRKGSNAQAAVQPTRSGSLLVEHLISLNQLTGTSHDGDVFVSKEPLQCPPWARGAYGGQIIAQALLAAYETVSASFVVHSIHCHFLIATNVDLPMTYVVYRLRDSKSFATRTVHAKQDGRLVFLATASFGSGTFQSNDQSILHHEAPMPGDEQPPGDKPDDIRQSPAGQAGHGQPCDCVRVSVRNKGTASERRLRQWIRARRRSSIKEMAIETGTVETGCRSPGGGSNCSLLWDEAGDKSHRAHVAALAYMSDNYFIGTVFRIHNATRFSKLPSPHPMLVSATKDHGRADGTAASRHANNVEALERYFEALAREEMDDNRDAQKNDTRVEMAVTLNHTIFFHNPRHFRADEWLLAEMESPWAGDERGVVLQRIWSHQGTLVATCIQEGVVRLSQVASKGKL